MNQNVKLDNEKNCLVAEVHSLSHDGRGIATIERKTTFISGALANETVRCRITQKRSSYNQAETVEILKASPERIKAPCPHFGVCGGCSLQHMSMESQLLLKQNTLMEQLKHFGKVQPESILPPLYAHSLGYRHKARLGVRALHKKDKLIVVGFREKSSRYLTNLNSCAVLHPSIGERLDALSQLIASLEHYQAISQVEVAIGDHETALIFRHISPLSERDKNLLTDFASEHHFHLYLEPNAPLPIEKLWPPQTPHQLSYCLPDYGLEFLFHPLDFTQVNLEMNRLMVRQAMQLLELKNSDTVLDLFCGIGNFSLAIAKEAKQVIGIEGATEMVTRAENNAAHNHISNAQFYAADLSKPASSKFKAFAFDKILLDPPRAGAKEILGFMQQTKARKIVYVSCNPATLARDAGELVHQYGYQLKQVGMMNMFPHTAHIEAMAVFEK